MVHVTTLTTPREWQPYRWKMQQRRENESGGGGGGALQVESS
jgi:hypothetical protein